MAADGPVVFVGHSVSAMIGLIASLKSPGLFAAQIMVGPSPCYVNDGDYIGGFTREDIDDLLRTLESNYLGWSSTMAPVIMGAPEQPALGIELTNSFCRTYLEIAAQFARVTVYRHLAVHGTINDLAMMGGRPLALSAGFVLEEGFP